MADEADPNLARPGDLKMSIAFLEMGGTDSWMDLGVWGALPITKEQADALNAHWEATMATVAGSYSKEASDLEKEEWRKARIEFRRGMNDPLTPDQHEVRSAISEVAAGLRTENASPDGGRVIRPIELRPLLEEQLEKLLTPAQLENYRSTSGISPTGATV